MKRTTTPHRAHKRAASPPELFFSSSLLSSPPLPRYASGAERLTAIGFSAELVDELAFMIAFSLETLWVRHLLEPPAQGACAASLGDAAAAEACGVSSCPNLELHLANRSHMLEYVYWIYPPFLAGQTGYDANAALMSGNYTDAQLTQLVRLYCGEIARSPLGDMNDLSAANDIAFWPTHPTIEQLFAFKVRRRPSA